MDKHTFVRAELKRRIKQLDIIAADAAVSKRTLYNILEGKCNHRMATLDAVYAYLKINQRRKLLK